jgi:hypothetical protein
MDQWLNFMISVTVLQRSSMSAREQIFAGKNIISRILIARNNAP